MIHPCSECGNRGRLNEAGVCEWREGCEHRQMQAEAFQSRIFEEAVAVVEGEAYREHMRSYGWTFPGDET